MTLTEFTTLVEIIGATSVLISFLFLIRRINQNTAMIRMGSASDRLQREFDIALPMIQSREIAELWIQADQDFENLDAVDQERMMVYERRAVALWHHLFILRERKLLADAEWHEAKWMIRHFGRRQANRAAWNVVKGALEKPFQDFVDRETRFADGARDKNIA